MTTDRYFLYLDILGFTDLVKKGDGRRIHDLYEVIASLNANDHEAFKVVVFSDTVLVYNVDGGDTPQDASYLVMFMAEFIKDLMHRLTGREIYFRAVITYGDFTHYELNGIPCFFGNALVDAYYSEKDIKAIGLFIDKKISQYCNIFKLREFNEKYDFIYVTQSLEEVEEWGGGTEPIPPWLIEDTDARWEIFPELWHLRCLYENSVDATLPQSVRDKYQRSWDMYCQHYPKTTSTLLANGLDVRALCPGVDWEDVIERHPEDFSDAIESRRDF